jgi:hypothetical protein
MELLQIVRTSIDTFHRQDLDAWLAPFAPDGTLSDSAAAQQLLSSSSIQGTESRV